MQAISWSFVEHRGPRAGQRRRLGKPGSHFLVPAQQQLDSFLRAHEGSCSLAATSAFIFSKPVVTTVSGSSFQYCRLNSSSESIT